VNVTRVRQRTTIQELLSLLLSYSSVKEWITSELFVLPPAVFVLMPVTRRVARNTRHSKIPKPH